MALNVSSTAAASARCSSAGATAASVVTNPSIVAIIGSIMPEPLAMPPTRKVPLSRLRSRTRVSFGNGSVVMMPRAASRAARRRQRVGRRGDAALDLRHVQLDADDAGRGDQHVAGLARRAPPRELGASLARRACRPAPVQALAQPLLTTIAARAAAGRRSARSTRATGAACAWFVVKTPPALRRLVGHDQREVERAATP